MPYRELPVRVARKPGDPPPVTALISMHERFARLEATSLWPSPADQPFVADSIRTTTVSGDGRVALIARGRHLWRLDTKTMTAGRPVIMPKHIELVASDLRGERVVVLCADTLYLWDERRGPEPIALWKSSGLGRADVVRISADGTVAVASEYRQQATVRVIDVNARTMTYSFESDVDEALALHPSGSHIVCFGDDTIARIYGRSGLEAEIARTAGGAFSNDGTRLATNSLDDARELRIFDFDASGVARVVNRGHITLPIDARRWDCILRFSPSDRSILIKSDEGRTQLVPLDRSSPRVLPVEMTRDTALTADERVILTPALAAAGFGLHADGVGVVNSETGVVEHMLCVTNGKSMLVAITGVGLYGSVESEPSSIGDVAREPYERPGLLPSILANGLLALPKDDQLHLDEVRARRAAWAPFQSELTIDIDQRQLMAVNRGLVELTGEIMHRARAAIAAAGGPSFGASQVHLGALAAAASELSSLSAPAREEAFADMLDRLRRRLAGAEAGVGAAGTTHHLESAAGSPALAADSPMFAADSADELPALPVWREPAPAPPETALTRSGNRGLGLTPVTLGVAATAGIAWIIAIIYFLVGM